jgi:hypothetical protein
MIRAVWSFWSKPYVEFHHNAWISDKHHLLSWILSVESVRKYYPHTSLITDNTGKEMLLNNLGLHFETVSLELNELHPEDPHWWVLGKLYAYRSQRKPFIHIDNDVFLWKKVSPDITKAPVFAQNPERFSFGQGAYRPDRWEDAVNAAGGFLPCEWTWYTHRRGSEAICCGIVGGCNIEFMGHYAERAIQMIQRNEHNVTSLKPTEKLGCNILFEQYFLSACINYHRLHPESPFYGIDIKYLFDSEEESAIELNAERRGYTHLVSGAKKNGTLVERLERRVRQEYPDQYRRLTSYLSGVS